MCRVLGASPSGYYAWQQRAPSARAQQDSELTMTIHTVHLESRGTYGAAPGACGAGGPGHSRRPQAGSPAHAGRWGAGREPPQVGDSTTRDPEAHAAPDLVQRNFHADGPDRLWVADITYVPTGGGFLYVAAVLDVWSRRVIGWAMATHLWTELVLAALDMALEQRQPRDVIHHSDHGLQRDF